MADALASGASVLRDVGVQVPLRPHQVVLRGQDIEDTNSQENVSSFLYPAFCDTRRGDEVERFRYLSLWWDSGKDLAHHVGLGKGIAMPQYAALTYTRDVDWSAPEEGSAVAEYMKFGQDHADRIRGGAALYPTNTATTVRVAGARGGDVVTTDGPYEHTKKALTGFYLIEAADLDEALRIAAEIPAAWDGAVEVRPVINFG